MTDYSPKSKYKNIIGICTVFFSIILIILLPTIPLYQNKEVNFNYDDLAKAEKAMLFFGYRGCGDICPLTLSKFGYAASRVDPDKFKFVFIDIDQNSSLPDAQAYAASFHQNIIAIHTTENELAIFSDQFGLNIQQIDEFITHVGKTYLLENRDIGWHITKVYNSNSLLASELLTDILDK